MKEIDFLTVFFAAIIYFAIYVIWYSKFLFKKIYQKEQLSKSKKKDKKTFFLYFVTFIMILIASYLLASFEIIMSITTFKDGVVLGFLIWLGFIATHTLFYTIQYKRKFNIYILDNILYLLGLMIMAGIIAG